MWASVLAEPAERTAFHSLLDEYFARPAPSSSPNSITPSATALRRPPPASTPAPSVLPTPVPAGPSFATRAQNAAAGAALRNEAATSSAFRSAGLSAGAANTASKFASKHSETLAPHVATAAREGWSRTGANEDKGPARPSGLSSTKTISGGFDASSGKGFAKTLFTSKGPLNKQELEKQKYKGPLYVKPSPAPGTVSHAPPPIRRAMAASAAQEERVKAAYDYDATEASDLAVSEGEELVIVERVGDDWLRCRNTAGTEGLVPTSYTQPI
ncbi:hypothetical protein JCM21900_004033 [Sporobolomyces salmonicolor]